MISLSLKEHLYNGYCFVTLVYQHVENGSLSVILKTGSKTLGGKFIWTIYRCLFWFYVYVDSSGENLAKGN